MPNLGTTFDASRVPPAEPGGAVWEGMVPCTITRTEITETANKDGRFLAVHVRSIAGEYNGQDNIVRLNLWNKNPQASEIGQRQLSSICHLTNRMSITDSDQLVGGQFLGVWEKQEREITDIQTGSARKVMSCQVRDFRALDGRTIKEMMSGSPAATPYNPGAAPVQHAAPAPAPQQPQGFGAPQQQAPQGFGAPQQQPQGAPQGNAGFPQAQQPQGFGAPQAGFGPPVPQTGTGAPVSGGGFAPQAPTGGMQGQGMPGFGTAGSHSNQPSAAPAGFGGGFQPGPAGNTASGGFGAPGGSFPQGNVDRNQPQTAPAGAPGGFGAPAPGAGPWGR